MDLRRFRFKPYMLLPILPLLAVAIFCLRYHQDLFSYYLPNSLWNDEVIYFKTIEGIKEFGIPQGYFGYNESHASMGTFGAWSPVIYLFDAMWGWMLGWYLYSPIMARVFFAIFCMGIYAITCKPNIKSMIGISLFITGFSLYARYLVSQMSDCYIVSLLIIFAGLYKKKNENSKYTIAIVVLAAILTLMRPYFVLLWFLIYSLKNEKKLLIIEPVVGLGSLLGYFVISKYLTAEYFTSLIKFDWIRLIVDSPYEGVNNFLNTINGAVNDINAYIVKAISLGDDVGAQYLLFYLLTIVFLFICICDNANRREWIIWVVINIAFWFAIVLLYDVRVGSRHLMPFIIMEGVVLIGKDIRSLLDKMKVSLIVGATCFLFMIKLTDPYLMTIPVYNVSLDSQIKEIREELAENIDIDRDNRWDNTVIWVLSDTDGSYPWQTLYALPPGMGISICTYDYVSMNFSKLNSRYIACTSGGDISSRCKANGYEELLNMHDKNICIYRTR